MMESNVFFKKKKIQKELSKTFVTKKVMREICDRKNKKVNMR